MRWSMIKEGKAEAKKRMAINEFCHAGPNPYVAEKASLLQKQGLEQSSGLAFDSSPSQRVYSPVGS
jgi:hypothetical protein